MTAHDGRAEEGNVSRLELADWRRTMAELYAQVRNAPEAVYKQMIDVFQKQRDALFKTHPQSPLDAAQRANFTKLEYFAYDPAWRVSGKIHTDVEPECWEIPLSEGILRYTRIARINFAVPTGEGELSLFWMEGYGGGMFLPFKDATNGHITYGGGRYLYDTLKGADLGVGPDAIVLDFNYAYNPSCSYNAQWVCPLPLPENTLPFEIKAGERFFGTTAG